MGHINRFSVRMDCGHLRWYPAVKPRVRDFVWCERCATYREVMRATQGEYLEDGYVRESANSRHIGRCVMTDDCKFKSRQTTQKKLEEDMFRHIAIEHGKSTLIRHREPVKAPEPTDKPPF